MKMRKEKLFRIRNGMRHSSCTYVWQVRDEVICVGVNHCFFDFFISDAIATVTNVIGDALCKEHWLLADDTNVIAQPLNVEIANVYAVDLHASFQWVVEPLN